MIELEWARMSYSPNEKWEWTLPSFQSCGICWPEKFLIVPLPACGSLGSSYVARFSRSQAFIGPASLSISLDRVIHICCRIFFRMLSDGNFSGIFDYDLKDRRHRFRSTFRKRTWRREFLCAAYIFKVTAETTMGQPRCEYKKQRTDTVGSQTIQLLQPMERTSKVLEELSN